jgi:hypothetical protein
MKQDSVIVDAQWERYTYMRDNGHLQFLQKADKCEKFFRGDQWESSDIAALKEQRRPALTVNKIASTLASVFGEQVQNRAEVLFRPASGSPGETAEALTKVWMQISQNNQLPWVRSEVFADGCIRSRGFYDVRMEFDDNMRGEVRITQLNSKNVLVDPDAEEYDPDKWADVFLTKWMTPQDIEVLYDKEAAEYLRDNTAQVTPYGYDEVERVRDRFSQETLTASAAFGEDPTGVWRNIRVLERQHRVLDNQKHFVDITNGDMRPIPHDWDRNRIASVLEKMGNQIAVTKKLVKRIRWTVTAGSLVLHDEWSPYKHFTVVPYFPTFRYGTTVGVVEHLIGSQELLNKTLSQELHVINTSANSGWIVKAGALVNMSIEELEQKGATTGLVLEVDDPAAVAKIQPNQVPTGLDRVSYKAEEHIKTISGVSDSMQGFDREDVAAKAIAYKQQRGSVNFTKVLDNLERTDWLLARNVLDLVQQYYTEERLINITHDDPTREAETIAVNQMDPMTGHISNDLTIGEYDIVITSQPYRATLEDSQFEQAKALREIGVQIPDAVLIENSRLMRKAEIVKQMAGDQESPEAQKRKELELRAHEAEVMNLEAEAQKKQADTQLSMARAQKEASENGGQDFEAQKAQRELELQQWKLEQEFALKREQMEREFQLKQAQLAQELELEREKNAQKMEIDQQKAAQEQELRARDQQVKEEQMRQQALQDRVKAARENQAATQTPNPKE